MSNMHPSLLDLALVALATWRVSHLLVYEVGPFKAFTRIRELTGIMHDSEGERLSWNTNSVLACMWCTSLWVSPVVILVNFVGGYAQWLIWVLACAGLAVLIEVVQDGKSTN